MKHIGTRTTRHRLVDALTRLGLRHAAVGRHTPPQPEGSQRGPAKVRRRPAAALSGAARATRS
jgi:hypothetical protein